MRTTYRALDQDYNFNTATKVGKENRSSPLDKIHGFYLILPILRKMDDGWTKFHIVRCIITDSSLAHHAPWPNASPVHQSTTLLHSLGPGGGKKGGAQDDG